MIYRFWIAPIGKSLGIRSSRSKKAANIPLLEQAYEASNKINHKKVWHIKYSLFVFLNDFIMRINRVKIFFYPRQNIDKEKILSF